MAIDTNTIIQTIMCGSRIREEKGIIPLFGVYLSLLSVQYYNTLSFNFLHRMADAAEAERLLVHAAQECGYATFQGIRNSWEWDEVVRPMVKSPEDQLMGFASVAVAFGWGELLVEKLVPGRELVLRVNDSYEADGFLAAHGPADSGRCFMLRGVAGAFMDLIYGGDYPDGCFAFTARESHCRVMGDACCEFIVQPKK